MAFSLSNLKIPGLSLFGGTGKKGDKVKKKETESYEDKLIEYLTSPSTIIPHVNDIQIDKYHRIIGAINYPRIVKAGWLTSLIEMNLDFDLSIHIAPYQVERSIKILENELKKQKTDIYGLKAEGKIIPQVLIQKHQDTKALLEAIQQGSEKMFTFALYIDAKAHDEKELDKLTSKITAKMNSIMITPKVPSFQMQEALKSVLPVGQDKLKITRDLTSSAAAACFPFAITSLEHQTTGILIGFNQTNNIPIIVDPFNLSNPNILILGTSGGGKSYCIKLLLMREYMEGVDINIIDPQAEYTDLVTVFQGKTIRIAPDSDTIINPFDLNDQTLDEKKLSLLAFFRVLLGELTEGQRAILDDAIDRTYEDVGISKDPRTWVKRPPTLEDLYEHVLPLTRSEREIIYKPAMAITNRLKSYTSGPLKFLNQQTKIDLDNRIISFDIRDIPDVGKGTIMFLILEYVYNAMKKSKKRKILVIDEAWTVLSAGEEAEYIFRLVKTCRKFNLSLVMITQDVEDILSSRAGRAVLTNTATKILMQQDPTVMDQISERFHLNEAEEHLLRSVGAGNALLIAENLRVPIYIQSSKEEHRIITTKPEDLKEMVHGGKQPEVGREMELEFDITREFHRKIKLTNEQIQTLQKIDFNEVRVQNLQGRSELFIIKNETNDVDEHFVLQHLIVEKIRDHSEKFSTHTTKLPDIIFESKDGRIIAMEIVADVSMKANLGNMEQKLPLLKKYDDYFFVVVDSKLKKYETFGEILIPVQVENKITSYFEK